MNYNISNILKPCITHKHKHFMLLIISTNIDIALSKSSFFLQSLRSIHSLFKKFTFNVTKNNCHASITLSSSMTIESMRCTFNALVHLIITYPCSKDISFKTLKPFFLCLHWVVFGLGKYQAWVSMSHDSFRSSIRTAEMR